MLSKPVPAWILNGGFILAAIAGSVNAVGFLGARHQALAHMSGPMTILSNEIARNEMNMALNAIIVIASFFVGCMFSAIIIGPSALKLGQRYGSVLMLESFALLVAWLLLARGIRGGEYAAAFACGLQNAMASTYSGAIIRTTHMTGMITDLGIVLGQTIRSQPIDRRRAGLYAVLLTGFLFGGICGSYGFITIGFNTLLVPAAITGISGMGYTLVNHLFSERNG